MGDKASTFSFYQKRGFSRPDFVMTSAGRNSLSGRSYRIFQARVDIDNSIPQMDILFPDVFREALFLHLSDWQDIPFRRLADKPTKPVRPGLAEYQVCEGFQYEDSCTRKE